VVSQHTGYLENIRFFLYTTTILTNMSTQAFTVACALSTCSNGSLADFRSPSASIAGKFVSTAVQSGLAFVVLGLAQVIVSIALKS
jgi:hypothetical protein